MGNERAAGRPGHARQGPPDGNDLREWWTKWAALGAIILAGLIGTVAMALATTATGPGPHEIAADRPGQPTVSTRPEPPVTSTSQPAPTSTTTSTPMAQAPTSTAPATTTPEDPFALCAAQGFRLGHHGHDLDWYQNHFDRDGDGIICN